MKVKFDDEMKQKDVIYGGDEKGNANCKEMPIDFMVWLWSKFMIRINNCLDKSDFS